MPARVGKSRQGRPEGFDTPVWDAGGKDGHPHTGKRFACLTS